MKIPCSVVRDLLPLYAEEMIEEETRALVDEHLEDCSDCSQKAGRNQSCGRRTGRKYSR